MSYLTLTEAAKQVPGRPHSATLWRWCRRGVTTKTGGRVRLQHVRAGHRLCTTQEWLDRFFRQLVEADAPYFEAADADRAARVDSRPRGRTARQRAKAVAEAEATLRRLGV